MYEAFFNLTARPFSKSLTPTGYFASASFENARESVTRCIERGEGPALVVGAPGTGKTLLSRILVRQLSGKDRVIEMQAGAIANRRGLFQAILHELELPFRLDEGELRLTLSDYIQHGDIAGNGLVMLIDEAQALSVGLLEELRLLTNLSHKGDRGVRLALFGGQELEERFSSPKLQSFNQRISSRSYLQPFNKQETLAYIDQCFASCGATANSVITRDAIEKVYAATGGLPRLINQVLDHALLLAFAGGKHKINAAGIEEAWSDIQQLPAMPYGASEATTHQSAVVEFGTLDEFETMTPPETASTGPTTIAANASEHLERIEAHLGRLEQEYQPERSTAARSVFGFRKPSQLRQHAFLEEEILVDRHASLDAAHVGRPSDTKRAGSAWRLDEKSSSRQKAQTAHEVGEPGVNAAAPEDKSLSHSASPKCERIANSPSGGDPIPTASVDVDNALVDASADEEFIVVEEDLQTLPISSGSRRTPVRRQEYSQLFARLRRG